MLKCNLAVLLAERKLKIAKVSTDTGISRTTLTALSSNQSQGIQFDTLNTLCSYLRVTPSEFFCYAPFEFKTSFSKDDSGFYVNIYFIEPNVHFTRDVYLFADVFLDDSRPFDVSVELPDDEENFQTLKRYMKGLSPIFKRELEQMICEDVYNFHFSDGYADGDCRLLLSNELKDLI